MLPTFARFETASRRRALIAPVYAVFFSGLGLLAGCGDGDGASATAVDATPDATNDGDIDAETNSSEATGETDTTTTDTPASPAPTDVTDEANSGDTPEPGASEPAPDPTLAPSGTTPAPEAPLPSAGGAVRLTQAELNNVLRDLLADGSAPATQFLAEDEFSPYDNDVTRQTISQALVDGLQVLSEDVALRAVTDATQRAQWMPCEPSGPSDSVCFDQTARTLGRLFFRRPLLDEEVTSYRTLLSFAEEQGDFFAAAELLLSSFVQDPEFLYRLERGTPGADGVLALNDQEVATRLAFLLWGSGPDDALLSAAEAGALLDSVSRRENAERLLSDSRARAQLNRFHAMWLGYRTLPHDATLNAAFQSETEHLLERVVFDEPQSYLTVFQSTETYLDDALATHYGLPLPAGGEGWISYPADAGRAGILSHGSVLSAFNKFSDTSPTQRGIFVRTRLLCQDVPPPPAVVDVDQPPPEVSGGCKVDRYLAHSQQSGCAECHSLFDPIGFGLEGFDMAGRARTHDDGNPDCPITATGSLPGYADFQGPQELSALLVENQLIQSCLVRQYLRFALAKGQLSSEETAYAADLTVQFEAAGFQLDQWLLELVSSDRFAQRLAASEVQP